MRTCLPCPAGERWRIRRRRRYGHSVEATVGRSFRTPAATPSPWRGLPARARRHVRGVGFSSDVLLANLETHRVVGSPAAVVAQLGVALRREPGCDAGAVEAAAEALADRLTRAGSKHRGAAAPVTEQVPARALRALPGWTISTTDRASSPRPPPPFPKSSHPAATRAPRPVAARPREREPGALAGRRGSGRQQAHRRLPQSRQRVIHFSQVDWRGAGGWTRLSGVVRGAVVVVPG